MPNDPSGEAIHGPYHISSQGQVKLPVALRREMGLEEGDDFYWRRSRRDPAILELIPLEVLMRRVESGTAQEGLVDQ